jgi:cell division protein FtsB
VHNVNVTFEELEARQRELSREAKAILLESVRESRLQTAAESEKFRLLDHERSAIARQIEDLHRGRRPN